MKDTVLGLREEYEKDALSERKNKQIIKVILAILVVSLLCGVVYYFVYYRSRIQTNYQATSISCVDLTGKPYELIDVDSTDVKIVFSAKTFKSNSRFNIYVSDDCYQCEVGSTTTENFRYFYYLNEDKAEFALLPEGYTSGYQLIKKNFDGTLTVELNYHLLIPSEDVSLATEWITYTIEFKPVG